MPGCVTVGNNLIMLKYRNSRMVWMAAIGVLVSISDVFKTDASLESVQSVQSVSWRMNWLPRKGRYDKNRYTRDALNKSA